MSERSFIDRAAEERRKRLVARRVVFFGALAGLILRLEFVQHGVDRLVGIGSLALLLHGIEEVHVGLIGPFIIAEHAHRSAPRTYSITLGTRKKCPSVAGALATISSGISPSSTTSCRFFISIGVTEVIGSTPSTLTSSNCSTKARMAFSSPWRFETSASVTAIRARCAIRRTVAASTDII